MWRPILFKCCPVAYNQETRNLEIMKGKFVGKCKPTRHKPLKWYDDAFDEDDDDDYDEEEGDDDDIDDNDDDGQVRDVVVADHIWQGLCLT